MFAQNGHSLSNVKLFWLFLYSARMAHIFNNALVESYGFGDNFHQITLNFNILFSSLIILGLYTGAHGCVVIAVWVSFLYTRAHG